MPPTDITEDEAIRVATEALEETKNHASGIGPYKVENAEFLIASAALDALSRHKDKATVTDPRDKALRMAEGLISDERDRMKYDKKHRSHRDYAEVSVDELDERIEFMTAALDAIRAARGAR